MFSPKEIAGNYSNAGAVKARLPLVKMFVLAVFAGAFIALAGVGATAASATIKNPSIAKLVGACVFPAGLALVLLAGSELFTGNCLIIIPVLEKKVSVLEMLRSWSVVWLGNFAGAVLISALVVYGHTFSLFGGALAQSAVSAAQSKANLAFGDAFIRGILCNFLVCLAVWAALSSQNAAGKVAALFFPIMLFVLCGFEHSVANMYYVPAGIFASSEYGISAEGLNWGNFIFKNLLPVTLGNIVGGSGLVGFGYWYAYLKKPGSIQNTDKNNKITDKAA